MNATPDTAQYQPLNRRARSMYQVTFSDQSMRALNELQIDEQLKLVDAISSISADMLDKPHDSIGRFHRDGRTYYRVRAGEFRCYFEIRDETLYSHYILHRNTLTDYVFRNKLPISEEQLLEQTTSFWKYLETLRA